MKVSFVVDYVVDYVVVIKDYVVDYVVVVKDWKFGMVEVGNGWSWEGLDWYHFVDVWRLFVAELGLERFNVILFWG